MSHHFLGFVLAASAVSVMALAQTPVPTIREVPVRQTSPASGQQMYATYCAACHGAHGNGNGPAAPALKTAPTDLTAISQRNGGSFPAAHVSAVLQFGVKDTAHGTADMPVWGDLMLTLPSASESRGIEVHQRISNLTDYLKQMQK